MMRLHLRDELPLLHAPDVEVNDPSNIFGSHIGGWPYWDGHCTWPVSTISGKPMGFIAQIDLRPYGSPLTDVDLLQIFADFDCLHDGVWPENHFIVRGFTSDSLISQSTFPQPAGAEALEFRALRPSPHRSGTLPAYYNAGLYVPDICDLCERLALDDNPARLYMTSLAKAAPGSGSAGVLLGGYPWSRQEAEDPKGRDGGGLPLVVTITAEATDHYWAHDIRVYYEAGASTPFRVASDCD